MAYVDASNCFDQIAHAMASLIFQAFGVEDTAISAMLQTIQEIETFWEGSGKSLFPRPLGDMQSTCDTWNQGLDS